MYSDMYNFKEQTEFETIMFGIRCLGVCNEDVDKLSKEITKNAFHTGYDRVYLAQCSYNILAGGANKENLLEKFVIRNNNKKKT